MDRLTPLIAFHISSALLALGLGAAMFARPKGTPSHRLIGRIWVASMAATAFGSFWIQSSGHFSWIHLLSAWTLFGLVMAVRNARRGNIPAHRGWMIGLYVGLAIAGAFTLLPSRLLGSLVFGI
ncbi:MAG: DUF2306 domain-containing protein [Telmatospirillum sp.]|nr:DUF2306 domain-containing protein [Telmatospirillum sp.]